MAVMDFVLLRGGALWRRRRSTEILVVLVIVCAAMQWEVTPAKSLVASFASNGEGAGEFARPEGLAVDAQTGDVLLADSGNLRVDRFGENGEFRFAWGWGVADGEPALETCEATCLEGLVGAGAGEFAGQAGGLAVDNTLGLSGTDVYALDNGNHRVQKFSPTGEFLLMFGGEVNAGTHGDVCFSGEECQGGTPESWEGRLGEVGFNAISLDSEGRVLVGERDRIERFGPSGESLGEISLPGVGLIEKLQVNSAGDIYVIAEEVEGVHEYNAAGTEIASFDAGVRSFNLSIAIGPEDALFIADNERQHILKFSSTGEQLESIAVADAVVAFAYSPVTAALYVEHDTTIEVVELPPPGPVVTAGSEEVTGIGPTTATLNAIVNPESSSVTSYHFEYGLTSSYGESTELATLSGGAFEDQPVSAILNELSPDQLYHFRVVATNALGQTTFGPDETFRTEPAVTIESESASNVTAESAHLEAALDDHSLLTKYHFEYGTTPAYGKSLPVPDAELGASSEPQVAEVELQGLTEDTTYHFRLVAENALGTVAGSDKSFTTESSVKTALIDGRGWERVSPADKRGVPLEALASEGGVAEASESGDAFTYIALGAIDAEPPGNRSVLDSQYLATRNGGQWTTQDITTPHDRPAFVVVGDRSEYRLFTGDLSRSLVEPTNDTPLNVPLMGPDGERTPYRREANGEYLPLVTRSDVVEGSKFGGVEEKPGAFVGGVHLVSATPDESVILLSAQQPLTEGLVSNGLESLYVWRDGHLTLVSVLPNGVAAAEEGLGTEAGNADRQLRGAISSTGNRVIFTTVAGGQSHIYLRDIARGETLQIDAAHGVKNPVGEPLFQAATSDGSRIFFTDTARLTQASTAARGGSDLYVCIVVTEENHLTCDLRDLTVDGHPNETADVRGDVLGINEDGSKVYFVANGALTPDASVGDCVGGNAWEAPLTAVCNLYVEEVGANDTTTLIGALANRDEVDWSGGVGGGDLGEMTSRVSSNGRFLAFMSQRALTGFNNRDAASGARDEEVFLYDDQARTLLCVSCSRTGARPHGVFDSGETPGLLVDRPRVWQQQWLAASIPGWTRVDLNRALYQSRYLSNSGRLFFDSADGLVPGDANGEEDVYEYEPSGEGNCTSSAGCVGLVSSGESPEESAFLDASESGSDVFFLTTGSLVSGDEDGERDIYDAHVCSPASPCPTQTVTSSPSCTTADSCRAAPAPQPDILGPPPTATFSGGGNKSTVISPPRKLTRKQRLAKALRACKKKPVRRRARCRRAAERRFGDHSHRKQTGKAKRRRHG
jgi:NHL repeat